MSAQGVEGENDSQLLYICHLQVKWTKVTLTIHVWPSQAHPDLEFGSQRVT